MGFEVCECGGLWVSCGGNLVVAVLIIGWLWWLFFGLLWIFFFFFSGCVFFFFKVPLVDVVPVVDVGDGGCWCCCSSVGGVVVTVVVREV